MDKVLKNKNGNYFDFKSKLEKVENCNKENYKNFTTRVKKKKKPFFTHSIYKVNSLNSKLLGKSSFFFF